MKKAVILVGGKQYLVAEKETLRVDLLPAGTKELETDALLVIDGDKTEVGTPTVKGVKVSAKVITPELKGDKIRVIRYKAKKRVHKETGHRQKYSEIPRGAVREPHDRGDRGVPRGAGRSGRVEVGTGARRGGVLHRPAGHERVPAGGVPDGEDVARRMHGRAAPDIPFKDHHGRPSLVACASRAAHHRKGGAPWLTPKTTSPKTSSIQAGSWRRR